MTTSDAIGLPAGQWLVGTDGARWFFSSGALCLEFGYTGDFGYGVPAWERLHEPADVDQWLTQRFGRPRDGCDLEVFIAARQLRAAIAAIARRRAAGEDAEPQDVDAINAWAVKQAVVPHLGGGTIPRPRPSCSAMLASIAQDAVRVFTTSGSRIRECAADDCRLIFFDASKPGRRRWCSMQRCGNRAKSRAHYSRNHR